MRFLEIQEQEQRERIAQQKRDEERKRATEQRIAFDMAGPVILHPY